MAIFTALAGALGTALIGIGLPAAIAGVASNLIIGAALQGEAQQITRRAR